MFPPTSSCVRNLAVALRFTSVLIGLTSAVHIWLWYDLKYTRWQTLRASQLLLALCNVIFGIIGFTGAFLFDSVLCGFFCVYQVIKILILVWIVFYANYFSCPPDEWISATVFLILEMGFLIPNLTLTLNLNKHGPPPPSTMEGSRHFRTLQSVGNEIPSPFS
eukprot:TRINITY_DN6455_c0_g1_i5.p1 TRINITY_DN6455_c0_g1~~TRINITY_DN6455_c0_g1_i5.p1  ORF type:complete len:163 (+),score=13.77 TRINITY_DN6455_c0_g1_i5:74-562(+)